MPYRDPYIRYANKYYSPALIQIYFGSILIDDIVYLEYTVNDDKQPLFGYSSTTPDAFARGKVLVTGSFAIAFRRTPLLQTILDYISRSKRLTEEDEIFKFYNQYEIKSSNILAYYRYAHASLAYPVGYIRGSSRADAFNDTSDEIAELIARRQAMVLEDPMVVYPEHPNHSEYMELTRQIEDLKSGVYKERTVTPFDRYVNPENVEADDIVPEFMDSPSTPFAGFYVTKDGRTYPFALRKTIEMAIRKYDPSNNTKFLTQVNAKTLDDFLRKLEQRLMGGPEATKARIRRVDEHDLAIDEYFQKYIDLNTFDIIIVYGDINTPGANSTVKVINDVHIIGEAQTMSLDQGPVLQRFTFLARNIDERPLSALVEELGDVEPNMESGLMDEKNAIALGDQKYKDVEWLYGHLEDKAFSFNHKQSYLPTVVRAPELPKPGDHRRPPGGDIFEKPPGETPREPEHESYPYELRVLPMVKACMCEGENLKSVTVGAMVGLIDEAWVAAQAGNDVEYESDDTPVKVRLRVYVIRQNMSEDSVAETIEEGDYTPTTDETLSELRHQSGIDEAPPLPGFTTAEPDATYTAPGEPSSWDTVEPPAMPDFSQPSLGFSTAEADATYVNPDYGSNRATLTSREANELAAALNLYVNNNTIILAFKTDVSDPEPEYTSSTGTTGLDGLIADFGEELTKQTMADFVRVYEDLAFIADIEPDLLGYNFEHVNGLLIDNLGRKYNIKTAGRERWGDEFIELISGEREHESGGYRQSEILSTSVEDSSYPTCSFVGYGGETRLADGQTMVWINFQHPGVVDDLPVCYRRSFSVHNPQEIEIEFQTDGKLVDAWSVTDDTPEVRVYIDTGSELIAPSTVFVRQVGERRVYKCVFDFTGRSSPTELVLEIQCYLYDTSDACNVTLMRAMERY